MKMHESIKPDVTELIKLLVSSVKTAKKNKEK
ncbi:MAG: four helix bundle protein, partial [Desulfobacteraceae bacterium 4572_88]